MAVKPSLVRVTGAGITAYLDDLVRLRIEVLRDYPDLYDGSLEYECAYMRTYAQSAHGVLVLAHVDSRVVGASTGIPLSDEVAAHQAPFIAAGYDPADIFYGGESVLLSEYRGSGVYRQFFLQREAFAREAGRFTTVAFCAIERPDDDRQRPRDYVPLDSTWARYGYLKHPELVASVTRKDLSETTATEKQHVYWLKPLPVAK